MKTKSLVTLEAELSKLWAANNVGVLDRDERGNFYVNETVSGIFSTRDGFVSAPKTRQKAGMTMVAIALSALLGLATLFTINTAKSSHVEQALGKSVAASAAPPVCLVDWRSLSPMEQDTKKIGASVLLLMREIVIGGVREQTIATDCGGAHAIFTVTFVKQGSAWKEKGAIPLESHP